MLINDSSTIAVEVPVWLYEKDLKKRLGGHIDVRSCTTRPFWICDNTTGDLIFIISKKTGEIVWWVGPDFKDSPQLKALGFP